jgi:hypothetical protein
MKYLISFLFITFLSFFSVKAQYTLSVEVGYSDYVTKQPPNAREQTLEYLINFEPDLSLRVAFDRRFTREKFTGILGLTYYDVQAQNLFFEEWTNTFLGVHIGTEYKIKKFHIGLHSYPAIRWSSSISFNGFAGNKELVINTNINPSLAYEITKKLMAKLSFSYGLNKALKPRVNNEYHINALRIGLQYELFKAKNKKKR